MRWFREMTMASQIRLSPIRFLAGAFIISGLLTTPPLAHADTTQATQTTASQEAQQVLEMLNDPKKREAFTQTLNAIIKAQQGSTPAATAPSSAASASSDSTAPVISEVVTPRYAALGMDIKSEIITVRRNIAQYVHSFMSLFSDFAFVAHWFHTEISDPASRKTLVDAFARGIGIFLISLAAERGLSLLLRRTLRNVTSSAIRMEKRQTAKTSSATAIQDASDAQDPTSGEERVQDARRQRETLRILSRIPFALLHIAIKLLPVALCAGIGFVGATLLTSTDEAQLFSLTLFQCYITARVLYMVVEMIFMPASPEIRLCAATTPTSKMVVHWWAAIVAAPCAVACLTQLGSIFSLSSRGTEAMIRAVVLAMHLILAAFIWRIRKIVAQALQPPSKLKQRASWSMLGHLASFWWLPAIFVDIALWVVWAAKLNNGYHWILMTAAMTIVVLAAGRIASVILFGLVERLFRISPEIEAQYPGLQKRANLYYPFARRGLRLFTVIISIILLLQVWGLPIVSFFAHNAVGVRIITAVATLAIAICAGITLWEAVNNLLERRIVIYSGNGSAVRASRLRTVLPIIRTVLATVIIIVIFITTLAQLGINITPILTGAGLLGAAIAFGSQSLVKDFITGFFMLVENAMQVGDIVTAGSVTGTVEHLSIRTLRLRASSGEIFIIPFSSVTSVSNLSRDYNNVVVTLQLALNEDPDRVVALMSDVVESLRKDEKYSELVLGDYEHLGINQADGTGSAIIGRIRTRAGSRDAVDREFFARLRPRLVSEGVQFPGSTITSQLVTPQPIEIRVSSSDPLSPPSGDASHDPTPPAASGSPEPPVLGHA